MKKKFSPKWYLGFIFLAFFLIGGSFLLYKMLGGADLLSPGPGGPPLVRYFKWPFAFFLLLVVIPY